MLTRQEVEFRRPVLEKDYKDLGLSVCVYSDSIMGSVKIYGNNNVLCAFACLPGRFLEAKYVYYVDFVDGFLRKPLSEMPLLVNFSVEGSSYGLSEVLVIRFIAVRRLEVCL